MKITEYLQEGHHLPVFMKDFHDRKDLFKTIHEYYRGNHPVLEEVKIPDGHQYTVDVFLWFMATHGYKLQKIKKKVEKFKDPLVTIENFTKVRKNQMYNMIKKKY